MATRKRGPVTFLKDRARTLLGVRKVRAKLPPAGPPPKVGAEIYYRQIKLRVTQPITDEVWRWLAKLGCREIDPRTERRSYRLAPARAFDVLLNTRLQELDTVLVRIARHAR